MTDIMASMCVDGHPSKAKVTLFCNRNCFLIACMVGADSLRQMLLRVVVESSTKSLCNASYHHCSSKFGIEFHGIWAETNPNVRLRFHMRWWNLKVSKSSASSLESFVGHFNQHGSTWISNMNYLYQRTIVIPQLPGFFRMAKTISSPLKLVNSITSNSVNRFNFMMWTLASKWFPVALVPCSNGWRKTWWQMLHMLPGLQVLSMPQCK